MVEEPEEADNNVCVIANDGLVDTESVQLNAAVTMQYVTILRLLMLLQLWIYQRNLLNSLVSY